MWVYEGRFDIISRNGIQVNFLDIDLSSEKNIVPRLNILLCSWCNLKVNGISYI